MQKRRQTALRIVPGQGPGPAPASASDEDIIDAFAQGDRRASALVYDRLVGVVDATLYRVVGRREADHDDLVQAAFEQIIVTLSRRSFAGGCTLTGWAASIACHVGLNAIRSRRRARRVFSLEHDADVEAERHAEPRDLEAQLIARREMDRLRMYLAEMDLGRAMTVFVHDVFGASLAETAKLTGVSVAAAQSRLVRGRHELRQRMAETEIP